MSSSDWYNSPRNNNGLEGARANGYGVMQSFYENDKIFALQYIAATDWLKISNLILHSILLKTKAT